ncbi:hypothetical protein BR93DRAFT_970853 [Coniochaeta sp. PMI_546]|nr:hypothetical protein BR93DRAFT_970853 [Coniochaeta sp. PMI_546]
MRNLNVFRDRDLPEVANKVNDLWKLCNDAVKEAETDSQYKVDKYRRKLFEKSQRLASYLETINAQAHAIDNLEGQIQEMNSYIEKLKQQVRVYSEKVPVLMDNCRILKCALDSTIDEHKQYQKRSQDVIEEIRTEKQREQSARELVERQLAAVREHLKERVHQVEVHCQEECRRVNEKMQLLTQQVHEKDSQIQRERVMADQLSKQLEEYQQAQSSLEDLRAQTSDIVKMLNERHANDYVEQLKLTQVESRAKLDNITKHLESLRGLIVPQSDGVSTLGDKQAEGISRIMATLKTMYEAQADSKEAMKQLGKDLRDHVDGMWQHLKPREEALTQQLEEKRSENEVLRSVIDEREKERQLLKQQLEKANDARQAQEERIEELVRKVCQLNAQPQEDPEGRVGLQALTRENDDLKAQLAVKCSSIASFKTQLDAKNESYVADVASFGKEIKRLTQLLNDREESSKSATKKTLTTVQEDHQAKLQRLEVDMRSRLQLAEKDRQLVLDQLDETRKKLEVAEQLRHNEPSNTNALLQAALDEAELRNQKLVEDLKQKEAEVENDKTHFASLWNWAGSKAEAHGFDVDKIWKDAQEVGGPAKRWTCFLESILARIDMHGAPPGETPPAGIAAPHELDKSSSHARFMPGVSGLSQPRFLTQVAAGNGNDGDGQVSQQNFHLRPPAGPGGMLGGEARRVTVRSPHSGVLTPVPPSVEQEKARRRGNQQQPKPIMKRLTRSSAHADELRLGQDLVSASILPPGFGSLGNPFARSTETDEKEEIGIGRGDDPSGGFRSDETQGAVAGSGLKTKLKSAKRSRRTTEAEPVEPFSADPPKTDLVDDDDDVPQMKRAKVHKQKTPASSRRAKVTASRPKKQLSGLAAQGVVYGSFPAGVVHGGPIPPSEVTNKP